MQNRLGQHYRNFLGFCLCLVGLFMFASMPAKAQSGAKSDRITYVVKRGDTLTELAQKYLRRISDYRKVQRINRIRNPYRIPVGKKLSIPVSLLKYRASKASLSSFRGKVSIARGKQRLKPSKGLGISEGSRLTTAARSFLTLQLEDGSRISMPSNSRVRITRLRHILLTDSIDYEFAVDNGRVRSKIVPFDKKTDRYRVRTPVAVSAVRGTDYRTRVDDATGTAFSETVEGSVDVATANSGKNVSIPAGTGAAATESGELAKADLLSPPILIDPAKVQSEEQLRFAMKSRAEAVGHHLTVSTDAGFVEVVAEQTSDGNLVTLPSLPDGRYFAKAAAISSDGFQGMPSTYSFKRSLATLGGEVEQGDFGFRFRWAGEGLGKRIYRFQLMHGDRSAIPIVDEAALTEHTLTLSDLPAGEYYWRVGLTQFDDGEALEKWTDFEKLTVAG